MYLSSAGAAGVAEIMFQARIPDDDARWLLARKVAASATLSRSSRLSQLLLYLCEYHLLGKESPLTEQQIAVDVFERRTPFDPAADTIVRSSMLRLRQKLELYFSEEGAGETLRIRIPRGGYTPVFEPVAESEAPLAGPPASQPAPAAKLPQISRRTLAFASGILGLLCIALFVLLLLRSPLKSRANTPAEPPARAHLWASLFRPGSPTLIVAADSGLVLLHGITGRNTTLPEYLTQNFSAEINASTQMTPGEAINISQRRYTSYVDLELLDRLTHLPAALSGDYHIRFARDIHPNDLKDANVILSGSRDANPWVELFEPQLNFVLQDDLSRNIRAFLNRQPQPGEQPVYRSDQYEYGALDYVPNLSGAGNVLIIGGTSVAGTEAISDFLFEDSKFEPFLERISAKDGSLPHFEILLESRSLAGSASRSQIVAYRTYPNSGHH
jgi:hypothetical protein